jgi:DNA repair exonuclease SbcCD ATPase subunit
MKLLEFSYRNILSYGNKLQTFTFDDGPKLILVEGENGAGKSSIKEALTVSIYGRSAIRKMKDIPNWINKNAYTNVKFETSSGETIELDRGIDPNFSNIKINGNVFNLPDKRKVDEFIEEELSKIPFSVFCNTISLSFDDFKSFVNLSKDDKRKIVDRIFGIDILSDMRAKVKESLREIKSESDLLELAISRNESNLGTYVEQLRSLKEKLTVKKQKIEDELTSKIAEKQKELDDHTLILSEFKTKSDAIGKESRAADEAVSKIKNGIRDLSTKIEVYSKNRCPHCLNDLQSESSLDVKSKIEEKLTQLREELPKKQKTSSDLNSKVTDLLLEKGELDSKKYSISADLASLKKSLTESQKKDDTDDSSESISQIIENTKNQIEEDKVSLSLHTDKKVLYLSLDDLLSDSGIKKSMIEKIIPTLNARIQEISEKLEFKFSFEFDNEFDPHITYLGLDISPESLSSGQRKKMNLIVLLAFIEIIKMKHSQMNVMFLDEIFSSLDKNNVYKAISILKEYAKKYNMTIFVVSHEALPEEFFDYRIIVNQIDHFSDMEILKI